METDNNIDYFTFVFLTSGDKHVDSWVMDSGATSSATFDERDCTDIRRDFTVSKLQL